MMNQQSQNQFVQGNMQRRIDYIDQVEEKVMREQKKSRKKRKRESSIKRRESMERRSGGVLAAVAHHHIRGYLNFNIECCMQ